MSSAGRGGCAARPACLPACAWLALLPAIAVRTGLLGLQDYRSQTPDAPRGARATPEPQSGKEARMIGAGSLTCPTSNSPPMEGGMGWESRAGAPACAAATFASSGRSRSRRTYSYMCLVHGAGGRKSRQIQSTVWPGMGSFVNPKAPLGRYFELFPT